MYACPFIVLVAQHGPHFLLASLPIKRLLRRSSSLGGNIQWTAADQLQGFTVVVHLSPDHHVENPVEFFWSEVQGFAQFRIPQLQRRRNFARLSGLSCACLLRSSRFLMVSSAESAKAGRGRAEVPGAVGCDPAGVAATGSELPSHCPEAQDRGGPSPRPVIPQSETPCSRSSGRSGQRSAAATPVASIAADEISTGLFTILPVLVRRRLQVSAYRPESATTSPFRRDQTLRHL